jgi:hypothetical protein
MINHPFEDQTIVMAETDRNSTSELRFPQNGPKTSGGSHIGASVALQKFTTPLRGDPLSIRKTPTSDRRAAPLNPEPPRPWLKALTLNSEPPPAFPVVGLESGNRNRHKSESGVASNPGTGIRSKIE